MKENFICINDYQFMNHLRKIYENFVLIGELKFMEKIST